MTRFLALTRLEILHQLKRPGVWVVGAVLVPVFWLATFALRTHGQDAVSLAGAWQPLALLAGLHNPLGIGPLAYWLLVLFAWALVMQDARRERNAAVETSLESLPVTPGQLVGSRIAGVGFIAWAWWAAALIVALLFESLPARVWLLGGLGVLGAGLLTSFVVAGIAWLVLRLYRRWLSATVLALGICGILILLAAGYPALHPVIDPWVDAAQKGMNPFWLLGLLAVGQFSAGTLAGTLVWLVLLRFLSRLAFQDVRWESLTVAPFGRWRVLRRRAVVWSLIGIVVMAGVGVGLGMLWPSTTLDMTTTGVTHPSAGMSARFPGVRGTFPMRGIDGPLLDLYTQRLGAGPFLALDRVAPLRDGGQPHGLISTGPVDEPPRGIDFQPGVGSMTSAHLLPHTEGVQTLPTDTLTALMQSVVERVHQLPDASRVNGARLSLLEAQLAGMVASEQPGTRLDADGQPLTACHEVWFMRDPSGLPHPDTVVDPWWWLALSEGYTPVFRTVNRIANPTPRDLQRAMLLVPLQSAVMSAREWQAITDFHRAGGSVVVVLPDVPHLGKSLADDWELPSALRQAGPLLNDRSLVLVAGGFRDDLHTDVTSEEDGSFLARAWLTADWTPGADPDTAATGMAAVHVHPYRLVPEGYRDRQRLTMLSEVSMLGEANTDWPFAAIGVECRRSEEGCLERGRLALLTVDLWASPSETAGVAVRSNDDLTVAVKTLGWAAFRPSTWFRIPRKPFPETAPASLSEWQLLPLAALLVFMIGTGLAMHRYRQWRRYQREI